MVFSQIIYVCFSIQVPRSQVISSVSLQGSTVLDGHKSTALKQILFFKNSLVHYIVSVFPNGEGFFQDCCLLIGVVFCLYQLLGNMGKWDLLLPESALKELMLDKLLNRYLVITLCSQTLHNNAVYACRKVFQFNIFNVECVYFCCPCTCLDTSLVVYCPSLMFFCLISHFLSLSLSSPDSRQSAAFLVQRRKCLFASASEFQEPPSSESSYHVQTAGS